MAKGFDVRRAFHSPGLNAWITRDTAHLVGKLPDAELKHAVQSGNVVEIDLPSGTKTLAEAQAKAAESHAEKTSRKGGR